MVLEGKELKKIMYDFNRVSERLMHTDFSDFPTNIKRFVIYVNEETIGLRIKAQRIRHGWTQERLVNEMCVPKSTISVYENDRVYIKSSVILELAKLLETSPNYILGSHISTMTVF